MGIRTLDLFCGGGGSSWGAMAAGAEVFLDKSAEFARVRDILSEWRDQAGNRPLH